MRANNMQARILQWQSKAHDRNTALQKLEEVKQESLEEEFKKRRAAIVSDAIQKIPLRYQGKSWIDFKVENADQAKVKNIVERYAKTFDARLKEGTNLIFLGRPGTGKTFLSFMLYQQIVQSGHTALYEPSLDFLRSIQEKKFAPPGSYATSIEHYKRPDFLIIDEVTEGSGRGGALTDWERGLLFKLIDARYNQKCCTLIISNLTRTGIRTCIGEPTFDRFSDQGVSLPFNWQSYRK